MFEKYTPKHIALSEYLTHLHIDDIENDDDISFQGYDSYYWVLTRDEAWETVYENVLEMLGEDTYTFPIKNVIEALKIDKDKLQIFFMPYVLTGEFTLGKEIGGETLMKFINTISDKNNFAYYYTDYLFNNNRSGEILDSYMKDVVVNGFHIYER